ncbi:ABC transporter substrate-binding protein [Bacteroidales bacterium OttesenSCG-928-K03]|nr:ABC transporter substrate-binding protein [Odoribacter sp. OttesenSCG-928-L07]MDL2242554.1 ABC transporter substrate-binding protein [Bacteroidales bacterium OttesenSCG-928-K03]
MKQNKTIIFALIILLFSSCKTKPTVVDNSTIFLQPKYAKGFFVKEDNSNYYIHIVNPSDTSEKVSKIQLRKSKIKKDNKIVCFSTTHIAFCDGIGCIDNICGIPDTSNYNQVDIFRKFKNKIETVTLANSPKVEKILALEPDFITTSEYQKSDFLSIENADIKSIPILEYLETHSLGRAEWLKLFAFLLDELELADEICEQIFDRYNKLADSQKDNAYKPKIFDCMEYHGYWYAAGGRSYISSFYNDAGFEYIFADDKHAGSFPVSSEVALSVGAATEFWRIVFPSRFEITMNDIVNNNHLYKNFLSVKNGKVIVCNPSTTQYYIEDILEPDVVLADFINCKIGNDAMNKYYKLLCDEE